MLVRCDRCGEVQPNEPWRCRACRAVMPHQRELLRGLLAVAAGIGLALLVAAVVRFTFP
jgi:hypothetical protein